MNDKSIKSSLARDQFMLQKAKEEWDAIDEDFVLYGTMEYLKIPMKYEKTKFDKLPNRYQKRLAGWADYELGYSDDWEEMQEVVAQ